MHPSSSLSGSRPFQCVAGRRPHHKTYIVIYANALCLPRTCIATPKPLMMLLIRKAPVFLYHLVCFRSDFIRLRFKTGWSFQYYYFNLHSINYGSLPPNINHVLNYHIRATAPWCSGWRKEEEKASYQSTANFAGVSLVYLSGLHTIKSVTTIPPTSPKACNSKALSIPPLGLFSDYDSTDSNAHGYKKLPGRSARRKNCICISIVNKFKTYWKQYQS